MTFCTECRTFCVYAAGIPGESDEVTIDGEPVPNATEAPGDTGASSTPGR